jgi:putative nucleotidyltransferase with HDIG domain/PAS domain S-box-containing protein
VRTPPRLTSALRVAALYLVFGGLWILVSDRALGALAGSPETYQQWQTYKGWAFVLASSGVIWALVRREARDRTLQERLLSDVLDLVPDPVVVRRLGDDVYTEVNQAFARALGRPVGEVEGRTPGELGLVVDPEEWRDYEERLRSRGRVDNYAMHTTFPDGIDRTLLITASVEEYAGQRCVVSVDKEITELEETRDRLEAQLRRVESLREIDMAITASLDVRVTLNVVLDQVTRQLDVDAADVLLLNRATRQLEFASGRGFRTRAVRGTSLSDGEGRAGRVARKRELAWVDDLRDGGGDLVASRGLRDEGFVSYAAVPLVAKGQVNGVLEVFHREPLDPPRSWFDFLEALAGQASIAVDNAGLYEDLQRSHGQLRGAYDETIEGWARALDLRDRETHGHTQRVARVTLGLAREMGMAEEDLVHVRRGALLHDIGKMGVPDAILQKPGSLDDDEWTVMKKHPELAYRLLSPIEFLRPALDIPRYHHEKWDGSGYPDGLRGQEIPLAARIFAVVDVWDALLSDRPYREPWSEDRVEEHLREESGSHFDPEVVEAFFALDLEDIPIPERVEREKGGRP